MKTELIVIAGFQGAGKTTFARQLLEQAPQAQKIVVWENESGKCTYPSYASATPSILVKSMYAGCVCCAGTLVPGMIQTVYEEAPDSILLEASGFAQLSDLLVQLQTPALQKLCHIKSICLVLDASTFEKRRLLSETFLENQIRHSDFVFLSKTEALSPEQLSALQTYIYTINPHCKTEPAGRQTLSKQKLQELIWDTEKVRIPKIIPVHAPKKVLPAMSWQAEI
ncbi:MAG: GTP-binding protein [Lachnospiraceae bacterium]